jgi:hypothetical protein
LGPLIVELISRQEVFMTDDQNQSLIPVEQKTITFYEDELTAVRVKQGDASVIYVPIRNMCANLGLTWPPQWQRIQRDEVLSEAAKGVIVTITPSSGSRGGGPQETICLPLDFIPGWLFGIQTSRVKEEIRDKLIRYRRECFRVLWDAFKGEILPAVDAELTQPTMEMTPAEQALATIEALHTLAKQQVAIERWLAHHDNRLELVEDVAHAAHSRLDKAAGVVGEHAQRLQRIELTISGGATVTDAQAAAISEAVKALAFELGKQEAGKGQGNPYQRVYTELYRKFHVPSYKAVPLEKFPAVMNWLTAWWQELTEEDPPFAAGVGGQLELP